MKGESLEDLPFW